MHDILTSPLGFVVFPSEHYPDVFSQGKRLMKTKFLQGLVEQ